MPDSIWHRWNLDPLLIGCLVVLLIIVKSSQTVTGPNQRKFFVAGWFVATLSLLSPLCALSVAIFSARVGQHMILTVIAAPLIALGLPVPRARLSRSAFAGAAAFTAMLWFWHSPSPYAATFTSNFTYWAMHLTTFGSALWLWRAVLHAPPEQMAGAIASTLMTGLQMALLGALITFTPFPVYAPHYLTTVAWGLSPLADQQLGGVIMWLPGGLILAAAIMVPLGRILQQTSLRSS